MLGQQFYHETTRKVVVAFGTLFNDIHLVRKDNSGTIQQSMKVPLAYGPRQKYLVRLNDDPDLSKSTAVTLPRIGFEIAGISYDPTRKLQRVQKFKKVKGAKANQLDTQYMPVPYNIDFELYILSKQSDDALQIVEQILPYFQPDYTVTINDNTDMGIKRDVPVILNSIGYEDDYQGDFASRRAIIYTLSFTAKFYLYGPVTSSKVIKTVQVDQYTDMPDQSPKREQRYTVTPNPTSADADDDFGFSETTSFFQDAKEFNSETGSDE
ncbi:MAG: tail sheath stabilizer and completion protein [Candidatus Poseidoniales archaeon]